MSLVFWIIITLLLLIVLAGLLLPLWYGRTLVEHSLQDQNLAIAREQLAELKRQLQQQELSAEAYQQQRAELELNLDQDLFNLPASSGLPEHPGRWLSGVLLGVVPLLSLGLYGWLGDPQAIQKQEVQQTAANIEQHIPQLLQHLQQHPEDGQGWLALGQSYIMIRDYDKASQVYAQLYAVQPDNLEILLNYADTLAMSRDGQFSGEPAHLVEKALAIAPDHPETLWLAGLVQSEAGEYQQALSYWQTLIRLLPADNPSLARIQAMVANTRERATSSAVNLRVRVRLDPQLQPQVQPSQSLFVYLQAADARMPLAAWRKRVADLPLAVRFDDSVLLQPGQSLQGMQRLTVTARISRNGEPQTQSGDLIGRVELDLSQSSSPVLSVLINHRVD